MQKDTENRNKLRNDIILIVVLLLIAAAAYGLIVLNRSSGGEAVVTVGGEEIMRYSLSEDRTVTIGEPGESNVLTIKDGKASVTEADCPDKVCVRTGEIQYEGETIVCLPHELVVSIEGGERMESDAVSQ